MKLVPLVVSCVALVACASQSNSPAGNDETSSTTATAGDTTTGMPPTTGSDTSTTSSFEPDTSSSTSEANDDGPPPEPLVMTLIEDAIYYDGYAETVDEPIPRGLIRHSNAQYAVPFTAEQRELLQETLIVGVIVGARCDNYDRLGSVYLARVPKGAETYAPGDVERIEVARFVTPFMDMNDDPKTVPYEFQADNVLAILKDEALWAEHDPWFELNIFGVPYAANTEVAGCADRNDTQSGTLLLYTDSSATAPVFDTLIPVATSQPFNDYAEGASDEIGLTRKTISFDLPADAEEAQLVLITSNHGANQGGEEYIRREHFVYLDQELVLQYRPGRETCEPFRVYNTQANGIYGPSPRSDAEWQSFSNWCPGDVIDTRIIPFGPATAGAHEFVIDVPDATFAADQGDFPFSLYVQARTTNE